KGMTRALTVTAAPEGAPAIIPEPTMTVNLNDYTFTPDKPFTAGKHTVRIVNSGKEWHELVLIRLHEGKTLMDLGAWAQTYTGPPPGSPIGGASPLATGKE